MRSLIKLVKVLKLMGSKNIREQLLSKLKI
nr:MAG TPA: hypothetical protein [Caudoviricetes sp.]